MEMLKKKKKVFSVTLIILCVILALYTVILIVPLLWALYTSFIDYTMYDLGTAREDLKMMMNTEYLTWQNLITAFTKFKVDIGDGVHITEMLRDYCNDGTVRDGIPRCQIRLFFRKNRIRYCACNDGNSHRWLASV